VPRLSVKYLPSARNPTLSKDPFAVGGFAEWHLPSVTLSKEFAECKLAFAECNRYLAKPVNPVVMHRGLPLVTSMKIVDLGSSESEFGASVNSTMV
jgi:hypothetical protein